VEAGAAAVAGDARGEGARGGEEGGARAVDGVAEALEDTGGDEVEALPDGVVGEGGVARIVVGRAVHVGVELVAVLVEEEGEGVKLEDAVARAGQAVVEEPLGVIAAEAVAAVEGGREAAAAVGGQLIGENGAERARAAVHVVVDEVVGRRAAAEEGLLQRGARAGHDEGLGLDRGGGAARGHDQSDSVGGHGLESFL
jgi:hypothetical protein